jgi:hypothetical protein
MPPSLAHYVIPSYQQIRPMLPCSIHCPKCKMEAILDEPFKFVSGAEARKVQSQQVMRGVKLGGGFLIEKYPNELPWRSPENLRQQARLYSHNSEVWGVCTCGHCGYRKKHLLRWPKEAYFTTDIRGETLWAWSREQMEALKSFIASKDRKLTGAVKMHFWFLRYVPKNFLEVKHRAEALKKIDRLLTRTAVRAKT